MTDSTETPYIHIYLDLSHLHKWHTESLPKEDLDFLNQATGQKEVAFVLSSTHIDEILQRGDKKSAIELAGFLDGLPHTWIRGRSELIPREVKEAFAAFQKGEASQGVTTPFVGSYRDTLKRLDLEVYMSLEGKNLQIQVEGLLKAGGGELNRKFRETLEKGVKPWSMVNRGLIEKMGNRRKESVKRFKDVAIGHLSDGVVRQLSGLTNEDPRYLFIEQLVEHPEWTPSFWLTFFAQHELLADTGQEWEASHLPDFNHLMAVPYVNQITVDRQIRDSACRALNLAPEESSVRNLRHRMSTSIGELCRKVNVEVPAGRS